jgi:hypothetical protein
MLNTAEGTGSIIMDTKLFDDKNPGAGSGAGLGAGKTV